MTIVYFYFLNANSVISHCSLTINYIKLLMHQLLSKVNDLYIVNFLQILCHLSFQFIEYNRQDLIGKMIGKHKML